MSTQRSLLVALAAMVVGFPAVRGKAEPTTQPGAARSPATAPDMTGQCNALGSQWVRDLGAGYHAAIQPPFVVVAWPTQAVANDYLNKDVALVVSRLQRQYAMTGQIDRPLVVLLFSNKKGYRKCCDIYFDTANPPRNVFFRADKAALAADTSAGVGPLIRGLTQMMVACDFPRIPAWFNEGLAGLYEQCGLKGDKIVGLVNPQLDLLREALSANKVGGLEELTKCDFRGANARLNAAQARYLCQYMQDTGVLEKFYQTFRDRYTEDPTGLKFLNEAFAPKTLDQVNREWRQWVGTLKRE